MLDYMN